MDLAQVAVATIAWARDDGEEQLLRAALTSLSQLGLPVAVADKGNRPAFTEFLRMCPGFTVVVADGSSMLAQVRASARLAAGTGREFILYTEPDKQQFFTTGLPAFLTAVPAGRSTGVALAARSARAFSTFPSIQQYTERVINELWERFGGQPGDYSYGPMAMHRDLVPRLEPLTPDIGWGWRHFMVGTARKLGYEVLTIEGDYPCPPDQRSEDAAERLHRVRQLAQNVEGLIRSV